MAWERIQEGEDSIVEYDKERGMYRVSFFEDNHFVDDVMFDAYERVVQGEWIPYIFTTTLPAEFDKNGNLIEHEHTWYKCSICGRHEPNKEPHCHCGARMFKQSPFEEIKQGLEEAIEYERGNK